MLERVPLELLCSPHVHPSTRSYLIDFARRHWYGYSSAKLCVSMARNLHGRDLEAFLDETLDRLGRLGESVEELHLRSGPPPRSFGALAIVDSLPAEPATGTIPAITEPLPGEGA